MHLPLTIKISKSAYRHIGVATLVQSICVFLFTFSFIVHVDIAIRPTVPQLNTWWDRRTSHWPPAESVIKTQHRASVPNWFISYFYWVVDFFFTVLVFPQVFHCEYWIIPLNTFKIRICEQVRLKSSVRVQSSLAIMWTLVSLITQNASFILFVFHPLFLSLHVRALGRNFTFPDWTKVKKDY